MGQLVVVQFMTLDGVVEDPDGRGGTAFGGWAMRHGPQGVAGDKFRLGPILERGTLLFGRRTWEHFGALWPQRTDPFSQALNAASKAVVSHRPLPGDAWQGSQRIDQPLTAWVKETVAARDVVVIGSTSVVDALVAEHLVDEYRLLVFPTAVGAGRRLFTSEQQRRQVAVEPVGPAALVTLVPEAAA